ncbi:hypothetical protein HYQ46_000879 [Verticillium longisporum]|nr:hypothetical protein HYQ46_000879 [Verticillium longisporum]
MVFDPFARDSASRTYQPYQQVLFSGALCLASIATSTSSPNLDRQQRQRGTFYAPKQSAMSSHPQREAKVLHLVSLLQMMKNHQVGTSLSCLHVLPA